MACRWRLPNDAAAEHGGRRAGERPAGSGLLILGYRIKYAAGIMAAFIYGVWP